MLRRSSWISRLFLVALAVLPLAPLPAHAQRMHDLRAAVAQPTQLDTPLRASSTTNAPAAVKRSTLGKAALVGAILGGIGGYAVYRNSSFKTSEAYPLFAVSITGIGAVIGAGAGLGLAALFAPNN